MTRRYGRALRGERVQEATPAGHWSTLTLLGALTSQGLLASMTVESPTDGDVFLAYLEEVLCPCLRPGHIVIADNLSAHKVDGVRERIEAAGATLLYLPTTLLAGLQSHRKSLVQDQTAPPQSQGPHPGTLRPGRR
jgi:DDE superfamily endonuclease